MLEVKKRAELSVTTAVAFNDDSYNNHLLHYGDVYY